METSTLTTLLIVFFVLLFSGIGILLIILFIRSKKKALESMSWPEVKGTIIRSEVAVGESAFSSEDDEGQLMYSAEVSYTYQVGDMVYTSDRISFAAKSSYSKEEKAETQLAQYPEGASVAVFYNPQEPEVSVLEQSAKGSGALLAAGIVFLTIGVITLIVGIIILI